MDENTNEQDALAAASEEAQKYRIESDEQFLTDKQTCLNFLNMVQTSLLNEIAAYEGSPNPMHFSHRVSLANKLEQIGEVMVSLTNVQFSPPKEESKIQTLSESEVRSVSKKIEGNARQ